MRFLLTHIILIMMLFSCAKRTGLQFDDPKADALKIEKERASMESARLQFERDKKAAWDDIQSNANQDLKAMAPVIERKCFSCHDTNTKLPFYGRIFRSHNPVNAHRVNGIAALDFSEGFPLKAKGNPSQISILKAIRSAVLDRTMPLKIYTTIYPGRKINQDDEKIILEWVDPLISKIEDYDLKFGKKQTPIATLLENKCLRCHGNGNARGGFGELEKLDLILRSKYVNHDVPEESRLYKIMASGKMPPDPRESVSQDELQIVRDWILSGK